MKNYLLLFIMIIIFGLSWSVNKIALQYTAPANFALLRMVLAIITVLLINICHKELRTDMLAFRTIFSKQILISIFVLGIFQIGMLMALMNMGMHYIGSSVAAILGYTTPLLIYPISVLFLKQDKFLSVKSIGIVFGLCGIITILSSASKHSWLGELLLIMAAFSSGISMLYIQVLQIDKKKLYSSYIYQLIVATMMIYFLFGITNFPGTNTPIHFNIPLILCGLYCGVLATGIGFMMLSYLSAELPPSLLSFSLLGVPIVGSLSGVFFLGETMAFTTKVGFGAIICGLVIFLLSNNNTTPIKPIN